MYIVTYKVMCKVTYPCYYIFIFKNNVIDYIFWFLVLKNLKIFFIDNINLFYG